MQSFILTEVSDCGSLIVVTSSFFSPLFLVFVVFVCACVCVYLCMYVHAYLAIPCVC